MIKPCSRARRATCPDRRVAWALMVRRNANPRDATVGVVLAAQTLHRDRGERRGGPRRLPACTRPGPARRGQPRPSAPGRGETATAPRSLDLVGALPAAAGNERRTSPDGGETSMLLGRAETEGRRGPASRRRAAARNDAGDAGRHRRHRGAARLARRVPRASGSIYPGWRPGPRLASALATAKAVHERLFGAAPHGHARPTAVSRPRSSAPRPAASTCSRSARRSRGLMRRASGSTSRPPAASCGCWARSLDELSR